MMKSYLLTASIFTLISLSVSACHTNSQVETPSAGPEPQNMMAEFAQIWLDNGTNCSKIGMELRQFLDDNGEAWRNYLIAETIERVKDGQSASKALDDLLSLPPSIEYELEHSICQDNSVVRKALEKFDDEIISKVEEAAEAYSVN